MKRVIEGLTFWRVVAGLILIAGVYSTIVRLFIGLGASTNLSDGFPWGIWIGFDVLIGVGLAAGGFTLTAAVHIFGLEKYKPIVRPTVLTAFLGYQLVGVGLMLDIGRPWAIWHPIIFWNPHSVMFEVAWCVMLYTVVLTLEFIPMVFERFSLQTPLRILKTISIPVVICGVLLSTLHQSSLGTVFLIVPDKLHGLWYSPLLPLHFFLTAIAAGLGMIVLESYASSRAFGRSLEMSLLGDLSRANVVVLGLVLVVKLQDMYAHQVFPLLFVPGPESFLFLVEMGFGVVVPMVLLMIPAVRRDRVGLFCTSLLVVLGFCLNRMNVSITGIQGHASVSYFPSTMEVLISLMLVTIGFIAFALAVKYLEVFPEEDHEEETCVEHRHPVVRFTTQGIVVALVGVLIFGAFTLDSSPRASIVDPNAELAMIDFPESELEIPADFELPASEDSPGVVTFSHDTHYEINPSNCKDCHARAFPLTEEGRALPRELGEDGLHGEQYCGRCHNGDDSFAVDDEDDCESCHE